MAEMSRNAETTKIYSASLRVAILIYDVEQAMLATLIDTRDSSFSAKSSRHFELRSSLHVSDLAALTIIYRLGTAAAFKVCVCVSICLFCDLHFSLFYLPL